MINSITMTVPLAFEPKSQGMMQQPPLSPHQPLLTRKLLWRILAVSMFNWILIFGMFEWAKSNTGNDARYYDLAIALDDSSLDEGDVEFTEVTTLLNAAGDPFSTASIDAEGIALTDDRTLFISSEGDADNLGDPFLYEFSLDGQIFNELPIDDLFLPTADQSSDIQDKSDRFL